MLCRSGMAKLVRTPAMWTVAAAGRGRPFTSTPRSVVVPPAWPGHAKRKEGSSHPQACVQQFAAAHGILKGTMHLSVFNKRCLMGL